MSDINLENLGGLYVMLACFVLCALFALAMLISIVASLCTNDRRLWAPRIISSFLFGGAQWFWLKLPPHIIDWLDEHLLCWVPLPPLAWLALNVYLTRRARTAQAGVVS